MSATLSPLLTCSGCKQNISLQGLRVGDSTRCPKCDSFEVVTRSKLAQGQLPAARRSGAMTSKQRQDVDETLARIKLRRVGEASRHVDLYPSWAILLAAGQFWLSGLLAGENLCMTGENRRGRRLQVFGVVAYVLLGVIYGSVAWTLGAKIPPAVAIGFLLAPPVGFGAFSWWLQHAGCRASRDAGAGDAPVLLPLLVGLILAIAQSFALWIVWHSLAKHAF